MQQKEKKQRKPAVNKGVQRSKQKPVVGKRKNNKPRDGDDESDE